MRLAAANGVAVSVLALIAAPSLAGQRSVAPNGLAYSRASNDAIQSQPAAGTCHARGRGLYSSPDPRCTPGALNPAVTQATIGRTICRSGWTGSVRPPESITEPEKYASMAAYGDTKSASNYEYDHFVPLELGGATNDPRNLWPEPGASPNPKDKVEDYLNREVCDGRMSLARAQRLIVKNWVTLYRQITRRTSTTQPTTPAAYCRASAAWNSTYHDWDVYVHSNQPDTDAKVTGDGKAASYYTNSSGYADVYFYAGESAAGDQLTVKVGPATCYTTL
jgi:hypothetical protein